VGALVLPIGATANIDNVTQDDSPAELDADIEDEPLLAKALQNANGEFEPEFFDPQTQELYTVRFHPNPPCQRTETTVIEVTFRVETGEGEPVVLVRFTGGATNESDIDDGSPLTNFVVVDELIVVVPGNYPPDCSAAAPSASTLWPPNHVFAPVTVLGVTDPDADPVSITIRSISQDEPVLAAGRGTGKTSPDGTGVGTDTASVRRERNGNPKGPGDGRVYHIGFTADDGRGGTCSGIVQVCVPHDKGRGSTCVDGGSLYDSTVP